MKLVYSEKANAIPQGYGVYLHYNIYGEVTYVGKSSNIRTRLKEHLEFSGKMKYNYDFHYARWIILPYKRFQEALENHLIRLYNPVYNRGITNSDKIVYPCLKLLDPLAFNKIKADEILVKARSKWDYSDLNIDNILPDNGYFVYCLYNKAGKPIYIGQTNSLFSRLIDNVRRNAKNNFKFHKAKWIGFVSEQDRNDYKKFLLHTIKTPNNHKPKKAFTEDPSLAKIIFKHEIKYSDLIEYAMFE